MKKFTKEDIQEILQRLLKQDNYNDMKSEIEDIADELNIDITEPVEEEEEIIVEDDIDWDAEDSENDDDYDM